MLVKKKKEKKASSGLNSVPDRSLLLLANEEQKKRGATDVILNRHLCYTWAHAGLVHNIRLPYTMRQRSVSCFFMTNFQTQKFNKPDKKLKHTQKNTMLILFRQHKTWALILFFIVEMHLSSNRHKYMVTDESLNVR